VTVLLITQDGILLGDGVGNPVTEASIATSIITEKTENGAMFYVEQHADAAQGQ
jgi:hypothetical protein